MTEKQLNTARIWSLVMSEDKKNKKQASRYCLIKTDSIKKDH